MTNWEKGRNEPTRANYTFLARLYGVSEDFIRLGRPRLPADYRYIDNHNLRSTTAVTAQVNEAMPQYGADPRDELKRQLDALWGLSGIAPQPATAKLVHQIKRYASADWFADLIREEAAQANEEMIANARTNSPQQQRK